MPDVPDGLVAWLEEAKLLGLVGPVPVADHIEHARRFAVALGDQRGRVLDLGTGAGIPGLVLADHWPQASIWLLDGSASRSAHLERAVRALGLEARVHVLAGRAEELARRSDLAGSFDAVVARAFGGPAVTAECATRFLRVGGWLAVSEPPGSSDRWPADQLARLALRPVKRVDSIQLLERVDDLPDRYPRRTGIPAKRPLF